MNIALCFSGHLRSFRQNTTLKALLFDVNPKMDSYVHTYSHHNFTGQKWHADDAGAVDVVTDEDLEWIAKSYGKPKAVYVEAANAGYAYMPPSLANCGFRHTRQAVNELRRNCGVQYDLVCMMRFDIGLHEPLIFPDKIEPNTLYAAYNYNMVRQGLDSDTITYGTPEVIDAINIPAVPPELANNIDPNEWCGEKLCTAVRKLRGIEYKTHKLKHFFCRSNGELDVDQFDPTENLVVNL